MTNHHQLPEDAQGEDAISAPSASEAETSEYQAEASEHSEQNEDVTESSESPESDNRLVAKDEELQTLNDKYLRLAAEFDNYKRRVQRDQRDTVRFANERLLKDLLPTLDNLERALQAGRGYDSSAEREDAPSAEREDAPSAKREDVPSAKREDANIAGLLEGIDLTYKQFLDTLQKMGITQVTSVGETFDPTRHQAVGQVESPAVPENVIVDEYQKGYFLHDRILRPAMVTVAKGQTETGPPTESGHGEAQQSKEGVEA